MGTATPDLNDLNVVVNKAEYSSGFSAARRDNDEQAFVNPIGAPIIKVSKVGMMMTVVCLRKSFQQEGVHHSNPMVGSLFVGMSAHSRNATNSHKVFSFVLVAVPMHWRLYVHNEAVNTRTTLLMYNFTNCLI